jgi:hypothetical protein
MWRKAGDKSYGIRKDAIVKPCVIINALDMAIAPHCDYKHVNALMAGLASIALIELVLRILPGSDMSSRRMTSILSWSAPIAVSAIDKLESANAFLAMMASPVSATFVPMTATIEACVSLRSFWQTKQVWSMRLHGMR